MSLVKCSFLRSQGGPLEAKLGHVALKLAFRRRLKTSENQVGDLVGIRGGWPPVLGGSTGPGRPPGEEIIEEGKLDQRVKSFISTRFRPKAWRISLEAGCLMRQLGRQWLLEGS